MKPKEAKDLHKGVKVGISSDHWQIDVGQSVFAKAKGDDPASAFLPTPGKDRAQPHIKINECDH